MLGQIKMETGPQPAQHRCVWQQSPEGPLWSHDLPANPQSLSLIRTFLLVLFTVLWLFPLQQMPGESEFIEIETKPMNQPSVWLREVPEQFPLKCSSIGIALVLPPATEPTADHKGRLCSVPDCPTTPQSPPHPEEFCRWPWKGLVGLGRN